MLTTAPLFHGCVAGEDPAPAARLLAARRGARGVPLRRERRPRLRAGAHRQVGGARTHRKSRVPEVLNTCTGSHKHVRAKDGTILTWKSFHSAVDCHFVGPMIDPNINRRWNFAAWPEYFKQLLAWKAVFSRWKHVAGCLEG